MRIAILAAAVVVGAVSLAIGDWFTLIATGTVIAAIHWWTPMTRRLRRVRR